MFHNQRHQQILYALVSIVFAVILFLTAASSNFNKSGTQISRVTETYTHTLGEVPIDIKYDADKYFISGYSYEAKVYLTSTNRIKLDSEINNDTRKFKIVADLKNADTGTIDVPLEIKDLPDEMTATVSPETITVTIGRKKSKSFPVEAVVPVEQIGAGYSLKEATVDLTEVTVTSDEATIDQIDHVIAKLPDTQLLTGDYTDKVTLQAVASNGTILPTIIEPAKVTLKVNVKKN